MLKIVIFGVGRAFFNRIAFFIQNSETVEIVAFIDNDDNYYSKKVCNVPIYRPDCIKSLEFDSVVILSKKFFCEMKEQLINLGIAQSVIWNFNFMKHQVLRGKKTLYGNDVNKNSEKEKVLIISTDMSFSGGTRVAIYAAQALKMMGKEVILAAPEIHPKLLDEMKNVGLSILIWESLPFIFEEDLVYIDKFDFVIVNVFQMMNCAYELSKLKPVLWWIHEVKSIWTAYFEDTQKEFESINTSNWMNRLNIAGVSNISLEAFNYFYPAIMRRVLPFGIPDRNILTDNERDKVCERIVFAVMAGYAELKGQQVLIEALKKLKDKEKNEIEVWFIGPSGSNMEELRETCGGLNNMRYLGFLTHDDVISRFGDIDVVVCPSLIESMSMSIIEGMMFKKLCITSDMTGIAEYIEDGKNGFVFKVGDSGDLATKISWIVNNRMQWRTMQLAARETYEKEFSMKKFGERLNIELEKAKDIYEKCY